MEDENPLRQEGFMVKKGFSLLLAVLMLLSVFSFASAEEETEYRDTIYWLINTDQDTLDPQNNVNNSKVIPQFYSGLLKLNLEGQYELDIATGYEVSEDGLTWTFTLRDDVYFHSGKHCTAYDFEWTYARLLDEENPQRFTQDYSEFMESATALDDYTLEIKLHTPNAFFLEAIAEQKAYVLNSEVVEEFGEDFGLSAESVDGTGPFMCTNWIRQQEMTFTRFENYYNGVAQTENIVMMVVPDQTSRAMAMESGEGQIADGLAPDDVTRLTESGEFVRISDFSSGCHLFQFNCSEDSRVADPLVRQAICYAIDRETMCEVLFSGLGEIPMPSVMAPCVAGYSDKIQPVPYDPEKAAELLAEAGYPNGEGLTVSICANTVYNKGIEMGEMIKQFLENIGITVDLQIVERAVWSAARTGLTPEEYNRDYGWDMFIMGSGGNANANTLLYRIAHTADDNLNNYGFYSNARVDELLDTAYLEMDVEKRDAMYEEIAQIMLYDDPFGAYINLRTNTYVVDPGIEGFYVNPYNTADLMNLRCAA